MKHNNSMLAVAAVFVLAACAAKEPAEIKQEAARTDAIEKVVSTDIETTWKVLVSGLDRGDFKINALVKGDRTISVLIQSDIPSTYVDSRSTPW